ncbi:hypothetical protein D3C86_1056030 [compost metagenome]
MAVCYTRMNTAKEGLPLQYMLPDIAIRYLTPQFYQLSKSTFVKGMQCQKYLYLNKHKPKERTPHDAATLERFREGRDFEYLFKNRFSPAIDIPAVLGNDMYTMGASYTKAVLEQEPAVTIFEACFISGKTLVMTDVLVKEGDVYTIYEVKNSEQLKPVFVWDLSLQYYICSTALQAPLTFNIVLNDGRDGYKIIDLTEELRANCAVMEEKVAAFQQLLQQPDVPVIKMGTQCEQPYACEFKAYCSRTS